ncbi:unnamed protein product [Protopolystoma xenopodis]|uniref:Uncharacterized protein n=1 Tax=Protopolystoma xenopodis TaxID=117903 RepID=A0A448WSU3_9PLAT|nr:unnamed protein product [Protopolystoma xenopodis]
MWTEKKKPCLASSAVAPDPYFWYNKIAFRWQFGQPASAELFMSLRIEVKVAEATRKVRPLAHFCPGASAHSISTLCACVAKSNSPLVVQTDAVGDPVCC